MHQSAGLQAVQGLCTCRVWRCGLVPMRSAKQCIVMQRKAMQRKAMQCCAPARSQCCLQAGVKVQGVLQSLGLVQVVDRSDRVVKINRKVFGPAMQEQWSASLGFSQKPEIHRVQFSHLVGPVRPRKVVTISHVRTTPSADTRGSSSIFSYPRG